MKKKLTEVSILHYVRLAYRSVLFIFLLIGYIQYRLRDGEAVTTRLEQQPIILTVTWAVFVFEMVLRFFPRGLKAPDAKNSSLRTISSRATPT